MMHLRLTRRLRGCGFSCLRRDMVVTMVAVDELLTRAQVLGLLRARSGRFEAVNTNDTVEKMQKQFGKESQCTELQERKYS